MSPQQSYVEFRFYAELNDFILPGQQQTAFYQPFGQPASIKDLIEATGVPHTEIGLILVNSESVGFSYQVKDKDHISVYPAFKRLDVSSISRTLPVTPDPVRFILDAHLGKLARHLRMLGFDTLYQNNYTDEQLALTSAKEHRILLTRDRGLLKRKIIEHGYFIRDTQSLAQVRDIILQFGLQDMITPFSRCIACNGQLASVDKEKIQHQLKTKTRDFYNTFKQCPDCGNIYWEGSHYKKMNHIVREIMDRH